MPDETPKPPKTVEERLAELEGLVLAQADALQQAGKQHNAALLAQSDASVAALQKATEEQNAALTAQGMAFGEGLAELEAKLNGLAKAKGGPGPNGRHLAIVVEAVRKLREECGHAPDPTLAE